MEHRTRVLAQSIFHNIGVVVVGFAFAAVGVASDTLLGFPDFRSGVFWALGSILVAIGFLIRVWATYHFYDNQMKVVSLAPQRALITTGPYRYSRHPLYVGGNVFVFLGTPLCFGSPSGLVLYLLNIAVIAWMMRREERQLAERFGVEWSDYARTVRRWF